LGRRRQMRSAESPTETSSRSACRRGGRPIGAGLRRARVWQRNRRSCSRSARLVSHRLYQRLSRRPLRAADSSEAEPNGRSLGQAPFGPRAVIKR
jgi:hypothetical protein